MSLPKPYYQDDYCTIYNADCRKILPFLDPVDLVLTDPPYGINLNTDYCSSRKNSQIIRRDKRHAWNGKTYPKIHGDDSEFDPDIFLGTSKRFALFGANAYSNKLTNSYSWIVWDKKTEGVSSNSFSDAELIYCIGANFKSVRIFRHMWSGYQRASEIGCHYHPTQKPIVLIKYIISKFDHPQTILDPFMGSGTTLRAAKDLNRKVIGIEIEEKYCEIAVERLMQEVLPL